MTRMFNAGLMSFDATARQIAGHLVGQAAGVDRLGDVTVAAGLHGLLLVAFHGEGGQRHDDHVPGSFVGLELAGQRQAVHAGQGDVHQDQVRQRSPDDFLRLLGVDRLENLVALAFQHVGDQLEVDGIVVHDEDAGRAHASPP